MQSVAIVGGGISGLSAAYFLEKHAKEAGAELSIHLIESRPRLGGVIVTERSGGLSIIKDNAFSEVIFEPGRLQNTALIYDSGASFFHGFKPIARGKFRWAIAAQFCNPEFIKEKKWH
ncbi:MAG: FAD-dependent oxidoreductase [Acidobacteria bacterium]|nr:FAD-dependent oxidoreductase [Acidobacteriota bacterium]